MKWLIEEGKDKDQKTEYFPQKLAQEMVDAAQNMVFPTEFNFKFYNFNKKI